MCFLTESPHRAWLPGTLCHPQDPCHPEGGRRLQLSRQPQHPSLSAGSLLDFLKSDEGNKQPLPKLIDFSAQVRKEQSFPSSPLSLGRASRGIEEPESLPGAWAVPRLDGQTLGVAGMQERSGRGFPAVLPSHPADVCERRSGGFLPTSPLIAAPCLTGAARSPGRIGQAAPSEELGNLCRGFCSPRSRPCRCVLWKSWGVRVGACSHCSRLLGPFSRTCWCWSAWPVSAQGSLGMQPRHSYRFLSTAADVTVICKPHALCHGASSCKPCKSPPKPRAAARPPRATPALQGSALNPLELCLGQDPPTAVAASSFMGLVRTLQPDRFAAFSAPGRWSWARFRDGSVACFVTHSNAYGRFAARYHRPLTEGLSGAGGRQLERQEHSVKNVLGIFSGADFESS